MYSKYLPTNLIKLLLCDLQGETLSEGTDFEVPIIVQKVYCIANVWGQTTIMDQILVVAEKYVIGSNSAFTWSLTSAYSSGRAVLEKYDLLGRS